MNRMSCIGYVCISLSVVTTTSPTFAQESRTYAFDLRARNNLVTFPASNPSILNYINKNQNVSAIEFNPAGDILYAVAGNTLELGTLNQSTGEFNSSIQIIGFGGGIITGLTADPTDGTFYLSTFDELYRINVTNGVAQLIGEFTDVTSGGAGTGSKGIGIIVDIEIDSSGQMYAHEVGGRLWSVNKSDAAASFIGASGIQSFFLQGMDFHPDTNVLYAAIYIGDGMGSYGIWDVTSGAFTEILDLPSMGGVELDIAISGGTTHGYDFRGLPDSFVTFPVDLPLPLTSKADILEYRTFALDFAADGTTLHMVNFVTNEIGTLNTSNGCFTPVAPISGDLVNTDGGISCDPVTGIFYAVQDTFPFLFDELWIIDVDSGVGTLVASLFGLGEVVDIAFSSSGQLYAYDILSNRLFSVDKVTGVSSHVGSSGLMAASSEAQGMDFDPETDILYQAIHTGGGTGSYGFWDLNSGVFSEILALSSFLNNVRTGYALELAIGAAPLLGDVNLDGVVSKSDIAPFVDVLIESGFQAEADINGDGVVNLIDVNPFLEILAG